MTDTPLVGFEVELEVTADLAAGATGRPRTIAGLAVPFGVPSKPDAATGRQYVFEAPPTNADDLVDVVRGHDDDLVVGRLAEPFTVTEDGLRAAARIFSTTVGNDVLVEAAEGVLTGFSISAAVVSFSEDADGIRHVTEWRARHLGLVRRPAFGEAVGLAVAASQHHPTTTTTGGNTMPEQTPTPVVELPTVAELAEQVATHLAEQRAEQRPTHPLAQFATFADFAESFFTGDEDRQRELQAAFAIADQTTGDNPGVVLPTWRQTIQAAVDRRRPAINAIGTVPLPEAGMESSWPYLDPELDLDTIITQQETEKSELSGVKVRILRGTAELKTAGAVSDISYQLLRRSSPSYQQAYMMVLFAAWARYTEARFEAALSAAAVDFGEAPGTTAEAIRGQLFAASAAVEDATGAPANTVLVAGDLFRQWGALEGLHNPRYGTQNTAGTADARTLRIDVNGLAITRAPFLPDGEVLVTNDVAAKFSESGALVATAEDVRKLGTDIAVWGMYEDAEVYFPNGVVKLAGGGEAQATSSGKR